MCGDQGREGGDRDRLLLLCVRDRGEGGLVGDDVAAGQGGHEALHELRGHPVRSLRHLRSWTGIGMTTTTKRCDGRRNFADLASWAARKELLNMRRSGAGPPCNDGDEGDEGAG